MLVGVVYDISPVTLIQQQNMMGVLMLFITFKGIVKQCQT